MPMPLLLWGIPLQLSRHKFGKEVQRFVIKSQRIIKQDNVFLKQSLLMLRVNQLVSYFPML
jgi:hypothetical protein